MGYFMNCMVGNLLGRPHFAMNDQLVNLHNWLVETALWLTPVRLIVGFTVLASLLIVLLRVVQKASA
jgi:hypothetical protein